MKFMFSKVYRVTQKDFYARQYTSMLVGRLKTPYQQPSPHS